MKSSLSLYELNCRVAQAVSTAFPTAVWVTAEMADVRLAYNGHCYLEFVEKSTSTGTLRARARAVIWSSRLERLSADFETATGQPLLQSGLKVLVQVEVQMHEAYGYSLIVTDIDPTYTLGEMARRRQAILQRLADEGMLDMQAALPFPLLPQRVAVVSAAGAAGYGDFCRQLADNDWHLVFYPHLFPAVMQGQQTVPSVIAALERIYRHADLFDVVVIIRGGGATADLASFDDYELAAHVANFPLPVITGIGHDRDQTVLDAVAHTSVKTPTAAAALLIDRLSAQAALLDERQATLTDSIRTRCQQEQARLAQCLAATRATRSRLAAVGATLNLHAERLRLYARQRIERDRQRHDAISDIIRLVQPDHILRRGFSITRLNGHALKTPTELQSGQVVETQLAEGRFTSVV